MDAVKPTELSFKSGKLIVPFLTPSWSSAMEHCLSKGPELLKNLQWFGQDGGGKDLMNAETVELLCAYIDLEVFTPEMAKSASNAAAGLCTFVCAMKDYYLASKLIKPKLEALSVAEAQLQVAQEKLRES